MWKPKCIWIIHGFPWQEIIRLLVLILDKYEHQVPHNIIYVKILRFCNFKGLISDNLFTIFHL